MVNANLLIVSMQHIVDYCVNENAEIYKTGLNPSKQWIFRGIVKYNNFGNEIARITSKELLAMSPNEINSIDWKYKNGKGKWHVMDIDHGTFRTWGKPSFIEFA